MDSVIPTGPPARALGVDSAEDYDTLLLRLCSGEGDYVRMLSEDIDRSSGTSWEARIPTSPSCATMPRPSSPRHQPLAHALGPGPDEAYAPPEDDYSTPEELVFPPATPRRSPRPRRRDAGAPSPTRSRAAPPRTYPSPPSPRPRFPPMMPPPPRITAERIPWGRGVAARGPLQLLRRRAPKWAHGQLLSPLRPEPGADPLPDCQAEMEWAGGTASTAATRSARNSGPTPRRARVSITRQLQEAPMAVTRLALLVLLAPVRSPPRHARAAPSPNSNATSSRPGVIGRCPLAIASSRMTRSS